MTEIVSIEWRRSLSGSTDPTKSTSQGLFVNIRESIWSLVEQVDVTVQVVRKGER